MRVSHMLFISLQIYIELNHEYCIMYELGETVSWLLFKLSESMIFFYEIIR